MIGQHMKNQMRFWQSFKRVVAVLVLAVSLAVYAHPAHANLPVIDASNLTQNTFTAIKSALQWVNKRLHEAHDALKEILEWEKAKLLHEAENKRAQALIDNTRKVAEQQGNADINAKHTLSPAPMACQMARIGGARDALSAMMNDSVEAVMQSLLNGRAYDQSDTGGVVNNAAHQNILCKSGLEPDSDPKNCTKLSETNKVYLHAHWDVGAVLHPHHTGSSKVDDGALEYQLPALKTDAHGMNGQQLLVFDTGDNSEKLAFVAAWEYCSRLVPAPPANLSKAMLATSAGRQYVYQAGTCSARFSAAANRCFKALRYRLACPKDTDDKLKSSDGISCHDAQVHLCNFLKGDIGAAKGLSLGGHPSLENCETNGLSAAEADRILADRCNDENHLQKAHFKAFDAQTAEMMVQTECRRMQEDFHNAREQEEQALERAQADLAALEAQCKLTPPSAGVLPVGTSKP